MAGLTGPSVNQSRGPFANGRYVWQVDRHRGSLLPSEPGPWELLNTRGRSRTTRGDAQAAHTRGRPQSASNQLDRFSTALTTHTGGNYSSRKEPDRLSSLRSCSAYLLMHMFKGCTDMMTTRRFLAPLMVLAILLSSTAVLLPWQQVLAADYWSIAIPANADSDGSNEFLQFGTRSGATDGFDAGGIDVPSPPQGPGTGLSASFQIAGPVFSQLNADFREKLSDTPGSSIVWTLNAQSASQPIVLNWSNPSDAGVPSGMFLTLSGGGQTIDMRSTTSTTLPGGTHTITITASWEATSTSTPTPPATDSTGDDDSDVGGTQGSTTDNAAPDGDSTLPVVPDGPLTPQVGSLAVSEFGVAPEQALPDHEITISANICNTGTESATRTVSLSVDGVTEQSQTISLSGGLCQQVTFTISRTIPGTYQVAIDGMTGEFSVLAPETVTGNIPSPPQTGLGTTGIVVVAVMALLITAIVVVFRKM